MVLHPGKETEIARESAREKSQRHKQLSGIGLWIDNAALAPVATADLILANRARARLE